MSTARDKRHHLLRPYLLCCKRSVQNKQPHPPTHTHLSDVDDAAHARQAGLDLLVGESFAAEHIGMQRAHVKQPGSRQAARQHI